MRTLSFPTQVAILALSIATGAPDIVRAQDASALDYHLAPQDLASALRAVAHQSHRQIIFAAGAVAGKLAPALSGHLTTDEALAILLKDSGLAASLSDGVILVRPVGDPDTAIGLPDQQPADAIVVTGSRIRGGQIASPVTVRTQQEMLDQGVTSVADIARTLPSNFGGGQNPGVVVGAGGTEANNNLTSGATLNLRGIGEDATLTLLNGHRLAYNSADQGVDISTIPLAALDRIEVVADGASALYGSDAVGGVANILLKPDYEGVTTSARLGAATDGGDFQQQYDLVAGHRWATGGFIVAYDFERDTAVDADQRSYTSGVNPVETLLPYMRHHAVTLSGHQDTVPNLTFSIDGTFNKRWSHLDFALYPTGDPKAFGVLDSSKDTAYSISPSLKWRIGDTWTVSLDGTYAKDSAFYSALLYIGGAIVSPNRGCYCNSFSSIEANAEGPLFHLPAGDVRAAIGGGYHHNGLRAYRTSGTPQDITAHQQDYFGYGEVSVPVVGPEQQIPLVERLSLSGAVRHEDYPGTAQVTTPKLGLIYAPTSWLDLKGSWGKSFKAPTLYELYTPTATSLYPITEFGGTGYPATATGIEIDNGNPDLKPERATTWTATLDFHPTKRLRAQLSYFKINYRNRVVTPIDQDSGALSNPAYAQFVDLNPSDADKASLTNAALYQFDNETDGPVNLADIVAIVDDRYHNIARQKIHGIDATLTYSLPTDRFGSFTLDGDASYLHSSQVVDPTDPSFPLAGTIFNPPHWHARGGITWHDGDLPFTSFGNYIGSVRDNRSTPTVKVGAMTTLDLTARYHLESGTGLLKGLDLIASVRNLLNDKPAIIQTDAAYFPPFDSTNYSAIGRFVSLTVSKSW